VTYDWCRCSGTAAACISVTGLHQYYLWVYKEQQTQVHRMGYHPSVAIDQSLFPARQISGHQWACVTFNILSAALVVIVFVRKSSLISLTIFKVLSTVRSVASDTPPSLIVLNCLSKQLGHCPFRTEVTFTTSCRSANTVSSRCYNHRDELCKNWIPSLLTSQIDSKCEVAGHF